MRRSCALGSLLVLALAAAVARSAAGDRAFYSQVIEGKPDIRAMTSLGRMMFFDPGLSASGKTACATCHNPSRAFGPTNSLAVQRGGPGLRASGVRAVPSLTYTQNIPAFTEHFFEDDDDDSADQGPAGGRTWDGRAATVHDQARLPLLSPLEMANTDEAAVVAKLRRAAYHEQFRKTFGDRVADDPALAFKGMLLALEVFQQDPAQFYPYSSKYDAYLRGQTKLTDTEQRGLAAFNDPARGGCARCHPSQMKRGAFPQFTDFGFVALGVPRNPRIPANSNPRYFDLGLCGPLRRDLVGHGNYCGMFRTPSLRNVALRPVFFHNGVFDRLEDAVRFYSMRDTHPEKVYPRRSDGTVAKFDDLPPEYHGNVDTERPFGGTESVLSEKDVQDISAFLRTLTDGYVKP